MINNDWKEQCEIVGAYLLDRFDIEVKYEYGAEDVYDYGDKEIIINSASGKEKQFCYLLHEAGHAVIFDEVITNNSDTIYYHTPTMDFWNAEVQNDGRRMRRKSNRVSVVMDEVDAWRYGLGVAEELELFVDMDKFNKFMTKNLFNYMYWAVE